MLRYKLSVRDERGQAETDVVFRAEDYAAAHAGPLLPLVKAAHDELPKHPDLLPPPGKELLPENRGVFVVAYVNGRAAASGGYQTFDGDADAETVEFVRLYVGPHARRTGIGRALLVELEERALDDDYRWAVLPVAPQQRAAQGLYEYLGYHRFDGGEDKSGRLLYRKELKDH